MRARSVVLGLGLSVVAACAQPLPTSEDEGEDEVGSETSETGDAPPDLPGESESETETESETGDECPPPPCEACTCVAGELECACEDLGPAAGFVELPGVDYELGLGDEAIALSSTDSRNFWAFLPADLAPENAPIFLFFNGGPGVSSGMLLGLSTGWQTFDPALTGPDATVIENPHGWTSLGNLMWIDARQTGFSYGLLDDPSDPAARAAAMDVASFNAYRDAGDFVRTLLGWLADHPALRDNEIILVAESYGGTRAQVMLDMLLHPSAYADGSRKLRDPALVEQIVAHHDAVIGPDAAPEDIAGQFGRQILIQPAMTGDAQHIAAGALFEQPDSVIEQIAMDFGVDYVNCMEQGGPCDPYDNALDFVSGLGRSPYDYRAPQSWLNDIFALVRDRLNDSTTTEALLGVPFTAIVGLAADQRAGAWRAANLGSYPLDEVVGDWPEVAGALESWDRYFVTFNYEAITEFRSFTARSLEVDPADPHFGELFLSNLIWVDTLVTEATYDLVVHTAGIPGALATHDDWVSAVIVDPDAQEWLIEYAPELGVGDRIVAVPRYEASHAVTLDAPGELREDVELWLAE